ncbi:hypothetical protein [Actinoplanes sp. NPDC051494]|uniref:hypothetical protein n=1 Tax=Actinoplanes sp. NPDC051494 TaxID=3363907 RepID=UPI0037A8B21F
MKITIIAAVAAVTLAVGAGTTIMAAPASAAGPKCNSSTCSLWNEPSTNNHKYEIPNGASLTMKCWIDNQWWKGTNRWFRIESAYGWGFVIATQVSNQVSVGRC